jgi:hypothetical protein
MARLQLHASSGPVALAAANTNKVIFQVMVPANHRVALLGVAAFLNGATGTDTPVLCKLTRSAAGTGAASGGTLAKKNPDDAETPNTTVANAWATAPPTAGTLIEEFYCPPTQGFKQFYPPGQEIVIGGSALAYLAVEVATGATITGAPSVTIELDLEE